jgi:hypothetical protein
MLTTFAANHHCSHNTEKMESSTGKDGFLGMNGTALYEQHDAPPSSYTTSLGS